MPAPRESFTVTLRKSDVFTVRPTKGQWGWIAGMVALAIAAPVALFWRSAGEVVTFRVVDRAAGTPISNVVFTVYRPWPKAVRSLPWRVFLKWRKVGTVRAEDGVASLRGINLKGEKRVRVRIDVLDKKNPYGWAVFVHDNGDRIEFFGLVPGDLSATGADAVNPTNQIVFRMPKHFTELMRFLEIPDQGNRK